MPTSIIGGNTGNDFTGVQDCVLAQQTPALNINGVTIDVRDDGTANRRPLIRFTGLSNLPAGATITAALSRSGS